MRGGWLAAAIVAVGAGPTAAWAGDVVSETMSEPYPGIQIVERVEASPNNRIYVAYVSLCTDAVHMTATPPATSFQTPGAWGGNAGVQLALNGDFFASGPKVYGDAVGGGVSWPASQTGKSSSGEWYYQNYGWIAFGDGWVEFNHTERTKNQDAARFGVDLGWYPDEVTEEIPPGTQSLVSGFPELVIEGQVYTCDSPTAGDCFPDRTDMRDRHPRSAMGLSEDRQTLILVAVDGRDSPASVGMYGSELATLMGELGAWEAFNLDGGGSTAMWLASDGYVNNPSDGSARSVANHWGVFAGDAGGQPAAPGSCFAPGGCYGTVLEGAQNEPFGDMPPDSYGHDEAIALLDASWVSGCRSAPKPLYCPNCTLTRSAAAKLAISAAGLTVDAPAAPTFDDVDPGNALYGSIETAVAHGLMTGCSPTSFCPGDPLTRGELAGVIRRAAGWSAGDPSLPGFDDVPSTLDGYDDVQALLEHCAAEPCNGDASTFCPDAPVDRDEAAIMLARAFELVPVATCNPEAPGGSDGDGTGGDGSGGTGGASATSGSDGATSFASEGLPDTFGHEGGDGGCGCRTNGRPGPLALLLGLGLLGLRRRR